MPATGKYAPWRLWILVVFWVLQYIFLGISLATSIASCVALGITQGDIRFPASTIANVAITVVVAVLSTILTIIEPIFLARHRLTPRFYLISNIVKSICWIALTIWSGVALGQPGEEFYTDSDGNTYYYSRRGYVGAYIIVNIVLLLLFILPAVYGCIITVKTRRNRGTYNGVAREDPENLHMGGMDPNSVNNFAPQQQQPGSYYAPQMHNSTEYYAPPGAQSQGYVGVQPNKPEFAQQVYSGQQMPQEVYGSPGQVYQQQYTAPVYR